MSTSQQEACYERSNVTGESGAHLLWRSIPKKKVKHTFMGHASRPKLDTNVLLIVVAIWGAS